MWAFYILGSLANVLINSINGRKQRGTTKDIAEKNIDAQRENLDKQLKQQILLQAKAYEEQRTTQLLMYDLNNTWPLVSSPQNIAEQISNFDKMVPFFLIFAPMGNAGNLKNALGNVWTDMKNFFIQTFSTASGTPVILGDYKSTLQVNPCTDYSIIWNGIKDVPTLYIAPYSTDRDDILGFTVAYWGEGSLPKVQNFSLNIRRLYIDEIRKETEFFEQRCREGIYDRSENVILGKNIEIFEKEKEKLRKGATFEELDQTLNFYKDVKPTSNAWKSIANQINPVIKALSSSLVDMYFVCKYKTEPHFPRIVRNINEYYRIPDLLTQGMLDDKPKFEQLPGNKFLRGIFAEYSRSIAKNIKPDVGKKYIPIFRKALPDDASNVYEETLKNTKGTADHSPKNEPDDPKNSTERMAAEQGDADAQFNLGWRYDCGDGVEKNPKKAVELYRKAADQGHAGAQNNLGMCYLEGNGVEKNPEKAVELFRKAADQDEAYAQNNLGECFLGGYGVEKNPEKAVECFRKAAKQDNVDAQYNLGECYLNGNGVQKNPEEAVECFRKAAKQGNAKAQNYLGVCFLGGYGVQKNPEKAVECFRKAKKQDNVDAYYNLGYCYQYGEGVKKNRAMAAKCYRKAVEKGNENAIKALQTLEAE